MRMLRAGEDAQVAHLLTAERAARLEQLWEQLRDELAGELDVERNDADERVAVPPVEEIEITASDMDKVHQ